jgi:serine/threonine-protein kinase HipA
MTASEPFDIERLFKQVRQLEVHTPQGESGLLAKESRFVFNYREVPDAAAVSLTMPVRRESYSSGDLMGVFAMNRPEGYLRLIIEERLARYGAPSDMLLLFLAGRNQIGRLTYALPGESLRESEGERLDVLLSSPSGILFERLVDKYALASGISGIQPKAVVPIAAETAGEPKGRAALPLKTVIVKTEGEDFPGVARNEFLCMSVAKEAGLDVPDFWLSDDGLLFLMDRFDRLPDGKPLGFEDMSVLTGKAKYEGSYEMVAKAVEIYTRSAIDEKRKLFQRIALSCALRDGDAHMKNIGVVYVDPTGPRRLAPVYDVVCTDVYPWLDGRMALSLNKTKAFPVTEDLVFYGKRLGLDRDDCETVLNQISGAYETVVGRLEQDERYKTDSLLSDIRGTIEHAGVRPRVRPKIH